MQPYNTIVMKDLINNHKATRMLAIAHKDALNAAIKANYDAAETAAGEAAPEEPAYLHNTSPQVMAAVEAQMRADQATHQASVDKYNSLAKQYDKHNG